MRHYYLNLSTTSYITTRPWNKKDEYIYLVVATPNGSQDLILPVKDYEIFLSKIANEKAFGILAFQEIEDTGVYKLI